jgi:hypothetical protein
MKSIVRALAIAALAAPAAGLGLAAHAQPPNPPSGGQYGPPPSPDSVARNLRQQLLLRPDQEVALQSFVHAIQPPPDMQRKMYDQQQAARTMTTPQRMDMMVSNIDEMRQVILTRAQATKAFYGQLTPDQQRKFDQLGAQQSGGGG